MEPSNLPQLYMWFDRIYSESRGKPLHIFLIFPQIEFRELEHQSTVEDVKFESTKLDNNLYKIRIGLRTREAEGWLATLKDYWLAYITSTESSTIAGEVTSTWIRKLFPAISPARIQSDHLLDILAMLDELENTKLLIHDYILKRGGSRDRKYTSRSWEAGEKFDKRYALNIAAAQNRLIDTIHFTLRNHDEVFKAKISRSGHLVYYSGAVNGFSEFHRLVVSRVLERAHEYWESLTNRQVKIEDDTIITKPLIYNTDKRIELRDFLSRTRRALIKGSSYNVSVEHHGNPWLLIHILDRGDGSIYDLHGFSNQIKIVPSFRATSQSMTKLDSLIRDVIPEARVQG